MNRLARAWEALQKLDKQLRIWHRDPKLTRLVLFLFGFFTLGGVIFFSINILLYRIFSIPAWVEMDSSGRFLLTMPPSYLIGAYLGYKIGRIVTRKQ